jgi:hypothetical protein
VITSWLQTPPSEELRSFAIGITAIEQTGGNPGEQIVAFRGYNTLTILLKRAPFTHDELQIVRRFTASRAYDLVYSPDITPEDINQYNILSEEIYYQSFKNLLETQPRAAFYQNYPFHIKPTTDDYPFFYHLFKWSQASQVLSALGRTWQPFGGAGYFVILALLLITLVSAGFLILLPVFILRKSLAGGMQKAPPSAREKFLLPIYFGLIGFAYLLVEIPLIQQFILFLGQPAYAMTAVLFSLLLFSGLGSQYSARVPVKAALTILVLCLLSLPFIFSFLFTNILGLPLAYRLAFAVAILAPVGFLMGIPFPAGLRWFLGEEKLSPRLPWVWSINGAASVIASVLAALLALSFGLAWTLRLGACCYAAALIMVLVSARPLLLYPGAGKWHKNHPGDVIGLQIAFLFYKTSICLVTTRRPYRDNQAASFLQLLHQRFRQVIWSCSHNNCIVWGIFRPAVIPISLLEENLFVPFAARFSLALSASSGIISMVYTSTSSASASTAAWYPDPVPISSTLSPFFSSSSSVISATIEGAEMVWP